MNNAEVNHIFDQGAIATAVATALAGWSEKHPNATAEDILLAETDIRANIMASRAKDKFLNSGANRSARKAHIAQEAAAQNIQFFVMTEDVIVDSKYSAQELNIPHMPLVSGIVAELLNSMSPKKLVKRKVTFAVQVTDVEDGNKKLVYSLTAQNPKDEHDGLTGRETAIARYVQNMTKVMYLPPLLAGLPISDILQGLLNEGVVESYLNQFSL